MFSGESLRGYGYKIHQRDDFVCQYCGADGKVSFSVWLTLSVDHLLPKGHADRENDEFKVTACNFCNTADNFYFTKYPELSFDNMTREKLIEQRREKVLIVRDSFQKFWEEQVRP